MPKVTYDKKAGTKTVLDEKGKTVYSNYGSKNQTKTVYNKQGKIVTQSDGQKEIYNKQGKYTAYADGMKEISNKKGTSQSKEYTDVSGGKTVKTYNTKGDKEVKYTKAGEETYKKYAPDGSFTGYKQNQFGSFGSPDGGKKIPISSAKVKEETVKKETVKPPVTPPVKTGTGQTVAELWKAKTGTAWSEAKKQGLTDGSAKANLALMAKLKSGDYKPKAKEEPKPEFKISSNIKPNEVGPYYSTDKVEDPNKGKMGPFDDPNKPKLKRGGSVKSKITAVKSKIKAKIKSKIMAIKKPLLKAQVGMSTPQNKKSSSAQVTQYTKAITPGGLKDNVAKSSVGNFKRGGSIKMKTGGMVNSNKKAKNDVSPSVKGILVKVNKKITPSKTTTGRVGGISSAPKKAVPSAKFGGSKMKRRG
jgi:hypothetical protein